MQVVNIINYSDIDTAGNYYSSFLLNDGICKAPGKESKVALINSIN